MYKKLTCKTAILMKFYYELYSDEGLSSHFETLYCIYLTHEYIATYCQKVSLSQPQFIEHNFLFKNVTL